MRGRAAGQRTRRGPARRVRGRAPLARAQPLLAPIPKKVFNARLPLFEQLTLPSGLSVYSYQDDTLPVVSLALAVRSGSGAESADKAGAGAACLPGAHQPRRQL